MSASKRRRNLALPFLVTVASSCTVKSGSTPPRHQPVNPNVHHRTGTTHGTPPAAHPNSNNGTNSGQPPTVLVNPPAPQRPATGPTTPTGPNTVTPHENKIPRVGPLPVLVNPPAPQRPGTRPSIRDSAKPNAPTTGPAKRTGPTTTISKNPPAPTNRPKARPTKPKAPTTGNASLSVAPRGGKIVTRADGTCWWSQKVDCSDKTRTCNPPPPRRVKCTK